MGMLRKILLIIQSGARTRTVFLGVIFAALVALRKAQNRRLKPSFPIRENIPLLREERTLICLSLPAVTTVTFYKKQSGVSPAAFLRERVAAIVRANPWLAGRLLDTPSEGGLCIAVPTECAPCFEECAAGESELRPGMDFEALVQASAPMQVKPGTGCVDRDEPLFRVTLAGCGGGAHADTLALVVSISHVLGDGHTYYSIFSMLDPEEPIQAMDPTRQQDSMASIIQGAGEAKASWVLSPFTLLGLVSNLLRPNRKAVMKLVDTKWVSQQKRAAAAAADAATEFVSTNDVLSSSFFNLGEFDYGAIMVNHRGRQPKLGDDVAGNYEGVLQFWPEESSTPAGIRRPLQTPERMRAARDDVPSVAKSLKSNWAVVTNWASFVRSVALPGCEDMIHLPIMNPASLLMRSTLVIFKPKKDVLAALVMARSDTVAERLLKWPALGAVLSTAGIKAEGTEPHLLEAPCSSSSHP